MKRTIYYSIIFSLALLVWLMPGSLAAQAQQAGTVVINGGTLIDGNGGTPVPDSVIIIQGNRITNVGRKGQTTIPPNAQVINADGKFILPGMWDCQTSYSWWYGELMLNHGVTSTMDVGIQFELAVPVREAILHGKMIGPRTWTGIANITTNSGNRGTGLETPLTPAQVPKSAEEMRQFVRTRISAGADYIIFQDGGLPAEFYQAGFDEAKKLGKPVFTRASGPNLKVREAAMWGSVGLPHSRGIPEAVARDGSTANNSLDLYAEMDDAKANAVVQLLVQNRVALIPNLYHEAPSYPRDWARFEAEGRRLFANPDILAYYPEHSVQDYLANFRMRDTGAVRERRMRGYQNMLRFHKMFIDAGGRLLTGGDTNDTKAPGLMQHHEMQVMAEAGITPMKIIQAATKFPAQSIGVDDRLGTIEVGKLADVVIVNADPLQDIRNLTQIDQVVFDGKVVERTYRPWFGDPFLMDGGNSPTVEALTWVVALKQATFRQGGGGGQGGGGQAAREFQGLPNPQDSPQPGIETISPVLVTQGSPTTTVTLQGFNFVRRSRVYFDGQSVPYRAVSPTELRVTLDENLLRKAGRFDVVVENPLPLNGDHQGFGNGTSNKAHLIVNFRY